MGLCNLYIYYFLCCSFPSFVLSKRTTSRTRTLLIHLIFLKLNKLMREREREISVFFLCVHMRYMHHFEHLNVYIYYFLLSKLRKQFWHLFWQRNFGFHLVFFTERKLLLYMMHAIVFDIDELNFFFMIVPNRIKRKKRYNRNFHICNRLKCCGKMIFNDIVVSVGLFKWSIFNQLEFLLCFCFCFSFLFFFFLCKKKFALPG